MKRLSFCILSLITQLSLAQTTPLDVSKSNQWEGFYLSGSIGSLKGTSEIYTNNLYNGYNSPYTNISDANKSSAGLQLGYHWALNSYIFGIEADVNPSTLKSTECRASMYPDPACSFWHGYMNVASETKYKGSLRLKMGYAFSDLMVYVTGGLASVKTSNTLDIHCPDGCGLSDDIAYAGTQAISQNKLRATYGLGGEYAIDKHWRIGADYLFFKSPALTQSLTHSTASYGPQVITSSISNKYELLRVRLIYGF